MPTASGPARIEIGTGTPIIIDQEDQLDNCTLTIARLNFEHRTQASAAPWDYKKTGINVGLGISIADVDQLELIALAFNTDVITDALDATKKKIELYDDAGKSYTRQQVVVKPYIGEDLAPASQWWTLPSAAAVSTEDFTNVFGLEVQRSFPLMIMGLAAPGTRLKAVYGDITATP